MRRIETFKVGQKAVLKQKISQAEIDKFVDLTGDDNPLHTDEAYAGTTSYKGIVVHGMLGASFISTLVGKHLPGEGALWVSNKIDFHAPVRLNDELTIEAEVIGVHENQNLLTLAVKITNQDHQLVTKAECKVKVLETAKKESVTEARPTRRVALIVGGASGIGAATARVLAREGWAVAINYRNSENAAVALVDEIVQAGGEGIAVRADVTRAEDVQRMVQTVVQKLGGLHGLVNGASPRIAETKFEDLSWEEVQTQFDGQVKSAFLCIKAALPQLKQQGSGSIVNVGSIVTDVSPPPLWLSYNLAKHGIHGLTKCLAEILGVQGIRINTVAPGLTDTRFVAGIPEKTRLLTEMQTPLRRIATPEDIGETIAFLLSDGARHIAGETIRVNGGRTLI